jgi:hypothetical protein
VLHIEQYLHFVHSDYVEKTIKVDLLAFSFFQITRGPVGATVQVVLAADRLGHGAAAITVAWEQTARGASGTLTLVIGAGDARVGARAQRQNHQPQQRPHSQFQTRMTSGRWERAGQVNLN